MKLLKSARGARSRVRSWRSTAPTVDEWFDQQVGTIDGRQVRDLGATRAPNEMDDVFGHEIHARSDPAVRVAKAKTLTPAEQLALELPKGNYADVRYRHNNRVRVQTNVDIDDVVDKVAAMKRRGQKPRTAKERMMFAIAASAPQYSTSVNVTTLDLTGRVPKATAINVRGREVPIEVRTGTATSYSPQRRGTLTGGVPTSHSSKVEAVKAISEAGREQYFRKVLLKYDPNAPVQIEGQSARGQIYKARIAKAKRAQAKIRKIDQERLRAEAKAGRLSGETLGQSALRQVQESRKIPEGLRERWDPTADTPGGFGTIFDDKTKALLKYRRRASFIGLRAGREMWWHKPVRIKASRRTGTSKLSKAKRTGKRVNPRLTQLRGQIAADRAALEALSAFDRPRVRHSVSVRRDLLAAA